MTSFWDQIQEHYNQNQYVGGFDLAKHFQHMCHEMKGGAKSSSCNGVNFHHISALAQ
jgi:hypothetical protein